MIDNNKHIIFQNKRPLSIFGFRYIPFQGKFNTLVYKKRDDFSFPNANFPFMDGDVPLVPSHGVYISQLVFVIMFLT